MVLVLVSGVIALTSGLDSVSESVVAAGNKAKVEGNKGVSDVNTLASTVSSDVFDCGTYLSSDEPILPPLQDAFELGEKIRIASVNDAEYISGVWSPDGSSIVFSIPDGGVKVDEHDAIVSDDPSPLIGVGTSTLVLYSLEDGSSEQLIT